MNPAFKWCLTTVCFLAFCVLYGDAMYQMGRSDTEAKCRPTVLIPQQMSYPKTKKEMAMFLKTREAAGGVR